MNDMDFAGRYGAWAVIAGGSEGIGSAFAHRLAERGINLLLIARKKEPLEAVSTEIRHQHGVAVRALSLDLTMPDAMQSIVDAAEGCEVGMLIHNAGADTSFQYFIDRPLPESERVMTLNVAMPMRLVHHFGPLMAARGKGGIILCSSMGSLAGFPGLGGVYSGVKAFINMFAETLWFELGKRGVDVLDAIFPLVRTPAAARTGLKFDGAIKALDPFAAVDEVLAHIRKGPVLHVGGSHERAMRLRTLPRDQAVHEGAGNTNSVRT
jgi:short-subunit dehydrogenase